MCNWRILLGPTVMYTQYDSLNHWGWWSCNATFKALSSHWLFIVFNFNITFVLQYLCYMLKERFGTLRSFIHHQNVWDKNHLQDFLYFKHHVTDTVHHKIPLNLATDVLIYHLRRSLRCYKVLVKKKALYWHLSVLDRTDYIYSLDVLWMTAVIPLRS